MSRRPLRSEHARSIANLAIELGDPGRMAKARRIHRARGVGEVEIAAGRAMTSVTGLDNDVHDVEIEVGDVESMSALDATDLVVTCSCGDGPDPACTHGLAAVLGLAEAVEANGRMVDALIPEADAGDDSADIGNDPFFGDVDALGELTPLPPRPRTDPGRQRVDDVDAGPVFADAVEAIRRGVSRFRVR